MSDYGWMSAAGIKNLVLPQAGSEEQRSRKDAFCSLLARHAKTIKVRRHANVYSCGDTDHAIYWIQSGYIKQIAHSEIGKECILNIFSTGDFFGESCLAEVGHRIDTTTAMENATLKSVPRHWLLTEISREDLLAFSRELTRRSLRQQMLIADMVAISSEPRLVKTLLRLGSQLGQRQSSETVLGCRISQDELSCIVGTTRPRITEFMTRLRRLGLIRLNANRQLVLAEVKLMSYLSALAQD